MAADGKCRPWRYAAPRLLRGWKCVLVGDAAGRRCGPAFVVGVGLVRPPFEVWWRGGHHGIGAEIGTASRIVVFTSWLAVTEIPLTLMIAAANPAGYAGVLPGLGTVQSWQISLTILDRGRAPFCTEA